jgi:hypothetical protein
MAPAAVHATVVSPWARRQREEEMEIVDGLAS